MNTSLILILEYLFGGILFFAINISVLDMSKLDYIISTINPTTISILLPLIYITGQIIDILGSKIFSIIGLDANKGAESYDYLLVNSNDNVIKRILSFESSKRLLRITLLASVSGFLASLTKDMILGIFNENTLCKALFIFFTFAFVAYLIIKVRYEEVLKNLQKEQQLKDNRNK